MARKMQEAVASESKPFYMNPWIIGIIAVIVLALLVLIGMYNSFVGLRTNVDTQWSNVEVQYQRRADLIPNLVTVTSQYAKYEQSTLTQITELRSQWAAARQSGDVKQQMAIANQLDSVIARLLLVVENYPQLRAS